MEYFDYVKDLQDRRNSIRNDSKIVSGYHHSQKVVVINDLEFELVIPKLRMDDKI